MPVQITIIGLGQVGASIGLALSKNTEKVFITGHDKEYGTEQSAKKLGAVHATNHNLPSSVENADIIILAIPVHQIRQTFEHIKQDVKKDVVLIDLSLVKSEVSKWVKEILPAYCHYVGLVPSIGGNYFDKMPTLQNQPQPDLFSKSIFLLSTHAGTPGEAIKLATDLVNLLGASVVLTDFVESDGLVASAYLLPQLLSASLLNATIEQAGWQEAQKIASAEYFGAVSAFTEGDHAEALTSLSFQNRENLIRALERVIYSLVEFRDDLENKDETSFTENLKIAQQGRTAWLDEKIKGEWGVLEEKIEKTSIIESLFGSAMSKRLKSKDK